MTVYIKTDGACKGNPGPAAIGFHIDLGEQCLEHAEYIGIATNNEAEYQAGIQALEKALELGLTDVCLQADSNLMVQQVKGNWKVKTVHIFPLVSRMRELGKKFRSFQIEHIPRELNSRADSLANEGIHEKTAITRMVLLEQGAVVSMALPAEPPMMMPFGKHKGQALPDIPKTYLQWLFAEAELRPPLRQAIEKELKRR